MKKRIIHSAIGIVTIFFGVHIYAYLMRDYALKKVANEKTDFPEALYNGIILKSNGEFSGVVMFCSLIVFAISMYLAFKIKIYYRIPISLVVSVLFIVGVLFFYKSYFAW